jgi:hypothetical protein
LFNLKENLMLMSERPAGYAMIIAGLVLATVVVVDKRGALGLFASAMLVICGYGLLRQRPGRTGRTRGPARRCPRRQRPDKPNVKRPLHNGSKALAVRQAARPGVD